MTEEVSEVVHGGELDAAKNDEDSTRRCVECAEAISLGAKKCRHCGAYQRRSARWLGPLVTVLSLLIAIISLAITSREQVYDLVYPRTPLFAALEPSETATARLVVHNESDDSVVVENMMCFLKLTAEDSDNRYVDPGLFTEVGP